MASLDDLVTVGNSVNKNISQLILAINTFASLYNSVIAVANGGTGNSSLTANSVLTGNGTNPIVAEPLFVCDDTVRVGIGTASPTAVLNLKAGTAAVGTAPLKFTSGTNLTVAEAGVFEYDGTFFYSTPATTSGRGCLPSLRTFRLAANESAQGATIFDFFGATSSINLAASAVYDIEIHAYFTKTTAGTATWTLTASSAPTLISGYYIANPITGIAAGTLTSGYAGSQAATTAAFAATGSLSTGVNHSFVFKVQLITNLATTFKLQLTQSAGTATPLAGSYYTVNRISPTVGSYA